MDQKGVYQQTCSCSPDAKYVGQTRVSFRTRMGQHAADVTSPKTDEIISGISKHARTCNTGTIQWEEPKILANFNEKNKGALQRNLLIRESLEIRRLKTSMGQGLNDPQLCVRSNAWDPILLKLKDNWLHSFGYVSGRGAREFFSLLFSVLHCIIVWLLPLFSVSVFPPYKCSLFLPYIVNEIWLSYISRNIWLYFL